MVITEAQFVQTEKAAEKFTGPQKILLVNKFERYTVT